MSVYRLNKCPSNLYTPRLKHTTRATKPIRAGRGSSCKHQAKKGQEPKVNWYFIWETTSFDSRKHWEGNRKEVLPPTDKRGIESSHITDDKKEMHIKSFRLQSWYTRQGRSPLFPSSLTRSLHFVIKSRHFLIIRPELNCDTMFTVSFSRKLHPLSILSYLCFTSIRHPLGHLKCRQGNGGRLQVTKERVEHNRWVMTAWRWCPDRKQAVCTREYI